jgi:hypothetical protein
VVAQAPDEVVQRLLEPSTVSISGEKCGVGESLHVGAQIVSSRSRVSKCGSARGGVVVREPAGMFIVSLLAWTEGTERFG